MTEIHENNNTEIPFPYEINSVDAEMHEKLIKDFVGLPEGFYHVGPKNYLFPSNMKEFAHNIYNIQARPDDIWIVTFPRSGTTWTQELLWLLTHDFDYETAKNKNLAERSIFIEFDIFLHKDTHKKFVDQNLHNAENLCTLEQIISPKYEVVNHIKSPRIIKTHLPLSLLPPSVFANKCKIVYVARNPLDVSVSFYHHNRLIKYVGYTGDFENYWNYFEKGLVAYGPHLPHIKEAWQQKDNSNILFMFYENMIKDFPEQVKKVAKFLNKKITENQINEICAYLDIKTFKNNPKVNWAAEHELGILEEGEQKFVRNGGILKNKEFTKELRERALKWMNDNLKDSDLRFPIEELL